jgi:hypothetical protein
VKGAANNTDSSRYNVAARKTSIVLRYEFLIEKEVNSIYWWHVIMGWWLVILGK